MTPDEITFSSRSLTVGEWLLLRQIEKCRQDVDKITAMVGLIVGRSDPPVATEVILRLSLPELAALSGRMFESLKTAAVVTNMSMSMGDASSQEEHS